MPEAPSVAASWQRLRSDVLAPEPLGEPPGIDGDASPAEVLGEALEVALEEAASVGVGARRHHLGEVDQHCAASMVEKVEGGEIAEKFCEDRREGE